MIFSKDNTIVEQLWEVIFDVRNHEGSEYDTTSKRVSSIIDVLEKYTDKGTATELALKLAQSVKFPRKYASLSVKAIQNILPLMLLYPKNVSEQIKIKFENIKHLVETGEIVDNVDYDLEDYVIDCVKSNSNVLERGGLMEYLAISLVYGKHTAETIKAQVKNYHDIKYKQRNLRNPIVEQLVNETMQVVKAIWKQYKINSEDLEIRVELARDLKNSAQERDKIYKGQLKNQRINDSAKKRLQEEGIALTDENILKYRLYEQQKYLSPYSGDTLTVGAFDTYQIDHIIPKQRYYDDSFANKVLVEDILNREKSNRTAWEYITQQNSKYKIRTVDDYVHYVNESFFGKKKKNLLAEKIPSNPVERQLKDTQYISIAVKNELAKIVGSENVKTSTGEVTDFLRSRWGLKKLFMELTESRFKQMEFWDLDENGNPKTEWVERYVDENGKNIYNIRNWSKRYDHRHHAIDALVVALTEQSYIQRLNNLNKYVQDELTERKDEFRIEQKENENILDAFFNLDANRRDKILQTMESSRKFDLPISDLIKQVREHLETMLVSHKPKDKLGVKIDERTNNKQLRIRGALHQETYYGKLNGKDTKTIEISNLKAKDIDKIIDDVLKKEIDIHRKKYDSMKEAFTGEGLKLFNENRFQRKNPTRLKPPVYKVKVWYNTKETTENSLQRLYDNNEKQSVVTGDNYLFLVMGEDTDKGEVRVFDIASLYDSVDIAKDALKDGILDLKKKIAEDYRLSYGERNKVRGKAKAQANPDRVLFTLQQNELVYLPTDPEDSVLRMSNNEFEEWIQNKENKKAFCERIYKVVDFNQGICYFIPQSYAKIISVLKDLSEQQIEELKKQRGDLKLKKYDLNFVEFGTFGSSVKTEVGEKFIKENTKEVPIGKRKTIDLPLIQDTCIKIQIDWLGNIKLVK